MNEKVAVDSLEASELQDFIEKHGTAVRRILKTANVPEELFPQLCKAVSAALDALELASQHQACVRYQYQEAHRDDAQKLADDMKDAVARFGRLDGYTKAYAARVFASTTKGTLQADKKHKLGHQFIVLRNQPLLSLKEILAALAATFDKASAITTPPKGSPKRNYPFEQFTFALQKFWTEILQRRFTEQFITDYPDPMNPNVQEAVPNNDCSRFVLEAMRQFIEPGFGGESCRNVMRNVITTCRAVARRPLASRGPTRPS